MAKKEKEPRSRVLRLLMDGVYAYTNIEPSPPTVPGEIVIDTGTPASDWEIYTAATPNVQVLINRQYFDTQGYFIEEQTFFPLQPQVQQQGPLVSSFNATQIVDLITVKPIVDADLDRMFPAGADLGTAVPGSLSSFHNIQDIIYGRHRLFLLSADINDFSRLEQDVMWGIPSATARARIFITRIVYFTKSISSNQVVLVPPSAWVIGGVVAEEKDLVWMERLRRNYDHSTPVG